MCDAGYGRNQALQRRAKTKGKTMSPQVQGQANRDWMPCRHCTFCFRNSAIPNRIQFHSQFTNDVAGSSLSRSQAHFLLSEHVAQMFCEQPQHSICWLTGLDSSHAKQWNVAVRVCVLVCCSVVIFSIPVASRIFLRQGRLPRLRFSFLHHPHQAVARVRP